ncbi:hypothetical protein EIN_398290 [Entamoeba invadens IP1]|uniref:C_GCAxxG_C_C family protein n=1 Tax=Entamoeba invadens IP1 TaxID=370355 RepID=A0A0A1UFT2_ENTIV|nr:hypothetical protein EIN_398290 [Entamoeba invadens IP1]ELP91899.1 hypothetical protein EIN_398290 [Entamoeba invadens IP1]|eukprot:XP_004258670.1 hypothetical protein EIN_398290 [Entamoeba invadens IP1]
MEKKSISDTCGEIHANHEGNCAMSVTLGYSRVTGKNYDTLLAQCKGYGGGHAPEGYCGALYAAMQIAGPEKEEEVKKKFMETSKGCIKCKEIRGGNIIPCNTCVRTAAAAIEDL